MSKMNITRTETRLTFEFEGEKVRINGTLTFDKVDESITQMDATVYDKDNGMFVGNANVYVSGGEKPKMNISNVDIDLYADVTSDLTACLTSLKAEVTKTVESIGTDGEENAEENV